MPLKKTACRTLEKYLDFMRLTLCSAVFNAGIDSWGCETATLIIGVEQERLMIHTSVLCAGSDFFKAAFDSSFKEGLTSTMTLPEEEPRIVKFIVWWMYRRYDKLFPAGVRWPIEDLLQIPLLAEKWIIDELKQACYRLIEDHVSELEDLEDCHRVWETVLDSDMRYLVIGRYIQLLGLAAENRETAISRSLLQKEDL